MGVLPYIPIQFPEIPPEGPWGAYVLVVIWLPLLLRALFLIIPFRTVIRKLAPHSGWAIKQLKELPVRGFGLLAINEIFAFMIPPILVLIIRLSNNPIGWQSWSEVSNVGGIVLFASLLLWIFFDILRIMRVRRMMKAVEKHDIDKLRKVADAGLGARSLLRKFSRKDTDKINSDKQSATQTGGKIAKKSLKVWGTRALMARKLTPAGLVSSIALGAAVEVARVGASKISDKVDNRLQEEFDKISKVNTKTLMVLLLRDLLMGLVPLLILAYVPVILS
ncbi:MAG: hypothetical protein NZ736_07550 [Candidatus Poseidoniaceae archaeon]|nr:hypothetical protein [Candidatus Poseidoniaceae archaeon]